MRNTTRTAVLILASLASLSAFPDLPGKHPYYLHALGDLRAARWLIEHRSHASNETNNIVRCQDTS